MSKIANVLTYRSIVTFSYSFTFTQQNSHNGTLLILTIGCIGIFVYIIHSIFNILINLPHIQKIVRNIVVFTCL